MKIRAIALGCVLAFCSALVQAQSGGGGGSGSSSSGSSSAGGGSTGGGAASGSSSGSTAAGSSSAYGPAGSSTASSPSPPISGTRDASTLTPTLRAAPGSPGPNTFNALNNGTSANQLGTIGGSNSNGSGTPAPGSATESLSSINTGVMAPSSNSSTQPSKR